MKEKNIKDMIHYSPGGITSKVITKAKNIAITLFCMAKSTGLDEHTSIKEGIVQVLEGDGVFNLEGKKIKMLPGVIIFMNKNAVHSLKAKKNTSFLLTLYTNR